MLRLLYAAPVISKRPLVVGVDAGGTTVRAVVADGTGRIRGRGVAAGANPVSRGQDAAVREIRAASAAALSTVDGADIAAGCLGMSGIEAMGPEVGESARAMLRELGVTAPVQIRSDVDIAFAAGTPEPAGVLVLAGTGAIVAAIRDGRAIRRLDGYGWLLGDRGSAMWLGLRAVRAALADLDGTGAPTDLTIAVRERLGVAAPDAIALTAAVYAGQPVELAGLAPLVSVAADAGDQVATALVRRGAGALLDEVGLLLADTGCSPAVVLAGSVLLAAGPMREAVRTGLAGRFGAAPSDALDGAAAAAWCALTDLVGGTGADPGVHTRLVTGGRSGA